MTHLLRGQPPLRDETFTTSFPRQSGGRNEDIDSQTRLQDCAIDQKNKNITHRKRTLSLVLRISTPEGHFLSTIALDLITDYHQTTDRTTLSTDIVDHGCSRAANLLSSPFGHDDYGAPGVAQLYLTTSTVVGLPSKNFRLRIRLIPPFCHHVRLLGVP